MVNPFIGILVILGVIAVAMFSKPAEKLSFFDWHAAAVVFGGVFGSLLVAVEKHSLMRMLKTVNELLPGSSVSRKINTVNTLGLTQMRKAWREGKRGDVLRMAEGAETEELRMAADCLLRRSRGVGLAERFAEQKTRILQELLPSIEGWEMVARLAPSFGIVGTVTGMIQLFQNMGNHSGNLGGAMGMALLATLYGIALGAAVGGPMSSRLNNQLNERLALIDLMEKTVASLVDEDQVKGMA